ncbi:MAG TPA: glycosyltransferase family 2 protein [Longimicrobiales bacterium]|nr:glycosyltransferase family 2 protein [Longimicrobiales bacterium]
MIHGKRVCVVLPAYNAEQTLEQTVAEVPHDIVDDLVLVDDASSDRTAGLSRRLGLHTVVHPRNLGYGGNQKTCYRHALARDADVVVMLHPDYQYSPKLLTALASMVAVGQYDIVLGSRILSESARKRGMPLYKYVANRILTLVQNLLIGSKLSEFHTGYRAFSREVLETLPLEENSDDFVFDNQVLAQAIYLGFRIGEVSCPARYFPEASSIDLRRSIVYGFGVLKTSLLFRLAKLGLARPAFFAPDGRTLRPLDEQPESS